MKYFVYYIIVLFFLVSCLDGSQTPFDGNFTRADPKKELPFEKLVGTYELDKDSKKRYNISDSINLRLNLKDSTISTNKYISIINREIETELIERNIFYTNNYKEKDPLLYLGIYNSKNDNFYSKIDIYYRKKDSAIALYILTPPIEVTKENSTYIEADYLRYIKVKDSIKK